MGWQGSLSRIVKRIEARRPRLAHTLAAASAVALSLGAAACGGGDGSSGDGTPRGTALPEPTEATLVLDFVPNAVHTGIYASVADGCYEDSNIDLEIVEPTSTADTLRLIEAGKAEFGIADGTDVAGQIDRGRGAKGIMALAQRPLGGVITLEEAGITEPAMLAGKMVGITGVPSDRAVLDTVVANGGGDPSRVETVTIGFNGVNNLANGTVDGFTGFVAADATQLEVDGFRVRSFLLDEHGGPRYPGLVVFSTEERIESDPGLMRAFVHCTVEGYERALDDPEGSLRDLLQEVPGLDSALAEAQLEAYEPLLRADAPSFGSFSRNDLESLSEFMVENDLARAPVAPQRYATNQFLPGEDQ